MKILKNQLIKSLLLVLALTATIIFIILFIRTNNELSKLEVKYNKAVESSKEEKRELIVQNNNLMNRLNRKDDMPNNISLYESGIERLKEKGLPNPVQNILLDLTKHRELIPYEGILGGTMGFFNKESWVLNNKWVFAYFEDGHYGGHLLLEYNVDDNGKIDWKRIAVTKN